MFCCHQVGFGKSILLEGEGFEGAWRTFFAVEFWFGQGHVWRVLGEDWYR